MPVCVPPDRVAELWPHVEPYLRRATARARSHDIAALRRKLDEGQALLWLVWDGERIAATVATSISVVNGRKQCVIVACAGEYLDAWFPHFERLEQYARDEGCDTVVVIGRLGWQRKLKDYRPVAVTLEKAL